MTNRRVAAGGVVYCRDDTGRLYLLLIHDKYGAWTLPKGHLDDGETEAVAAAREIQEETGVACVIGPLVQRIEYPVLKQGVWYRKSVAYFLAQADCVTPAPEAAEGISAARWLEPDAVLSLVGYAQVREVVRRALDMLNPLPAAPSAEGHANHPDER